MNFPYHNPLKTVPPPGAFTRNPNAQVPPARLTDFMMFNGDDGLHTPNQLPLYQGMSNSPIPPLMFQGTNYFTCPDGTVIDMRTKRVVASPERERGMRKIPCPFERQGGGEWNDGEIMSLYGQGGLSHEDIEHVKFVERMDIPSYSSIF